MSVKVTAEEHGIRIVDDNPESGTPQSMTTNCVSFRAFVSDVKAGHYDKVTD